MAKIKAKKNEEVKETVAKTKKIKEEKIRTEEGETIHRFILIFLVIMVLVVLIYIISALVATKNATNNNNTTAEKEVEISYDTLNVGMILNRDQYSKYYVMLYDADNTNAIYYSTLITKYQNKEKHEKIYYCDLGDPLNKKFASETSNPDAKNIDEFAFGELTLLEITNGKVTKYIEDEEKIKEILK